MKIFITGGSSFIGAWIVKQLLAEGHQLSLLVRNTDKIPFFKDCSQIKLIQGDLLQIKDFSSLLEGHDALIHNARVHADSASDCLSKDSLITARLLDSAIQKSVPRFIFTSSTGAIGDLRTVMAENIQLRPNQWWCAAKAASEDFIMAAACESPIQVSIVRPGLVFAPPAYPGADTEAFGKFREIVKKASQNEDILLRPDDGTQFCFAGDLATVYSEVLKSNKNRMIYNVVDKERGLWKDFAALAVKICQSKSKILEDKTALPAFPCAYGTGAIESEFQLKLNSKPEQEKHIQYILELINQNKGE